MTFGVSPAFIVSKYGKAFSIQDYCDGLEIIQSLEFNAYQPEIFLAEQLDNWVNGGALQVHQKAKELGLTVTQFVAHFLLENFSSPEKLKESKDIQVLNKTLEVVKAFSECKVFTIPLGPFDDQSVQSEKDFQDAQHSLIRKIVSYYREIQNAGFQMALELLPGSVIGGISGFLKIIHELDVPHLGLIFDTGHAWACRELVATLPFQLSGRIFATHLCDNNSNETPMMPVAK